MTVDQAETAARALLGKRIEIPVHLDTWMRGARYGKVTRIVWSTNGAGERIAVGVSVRMDNPAVRRSVPVWAGDFDYVKVL